MSSLNTQGSIVTNPTAGILNPNGQSLNISSPTNSGILSGYSLPNSNSYQPTGLASGTGQNQYAQAPTTPGILPSTTHSTSTSATGATSTKPAPNPSVLAQQQWLNSQGAGLVEDGIAGPLTEAAIAKYGTQSSPISQSTTQPIPAYGSTNANGQPNLYNPNTGQPLVNPATQPVNTTAPGTNGNNGTNPSQNVANVQTASTPTPEYENTINQANQIQSGIIAPVTQAQMQGVLAPYSGSGQSIGQSVADISRPQSTGNLAGELGNLNAQTGVTLEGAGATLQGLGTLAGQELAGSQLETQGAENVLGASLPTQVSPGNTLVNPLTSQSTYGLGTSGTSNNGASAYQNFSNLQFNTSSGQQFAQQANSLQTAANQTTQNFQTLEQASQGVNLSSFPSINAASQFLQGQAGGAAKVSALNEAYNALQTSLANIISSGGSGLTPTQITSLTNGQNIASLSPSQLMTLYNTVQQTMATKISTTQQQAIQAEQAGTNFNNGTSTSSTSAFDY